MDLVKPLRYPAFALLWSGQTVSRLGDSFYTVALAWWVLEKTGSATTMGLVLIFSLVPTLLLLLLGGALVDRLPRLNLMLVSDSVRAIVVGIAALLSAIQRLEVWHVLVISILFGIVDAFFYPASNAVIPELVPSDELPSANSLRSLSTQFTSVIGPVLAGWIISQMGTGLAFGFDALSFVVSGCCLFVMPRKGALMRPMEAEASVLKDVREGWQTVLQSPWLWITIAIAAVSNITLGAPVEAALPLLVKQRFMANSDIYGFIVAFGAAGSMLAAIVMGWRKRLRRRGYLVYVPWLVACIALFFMGLSPPLAGMCLAMGIFNGCTTTLGLAWSNSLQELVPADRLGRVYSIDALGSFSLLPLGYAIAGIAADHIGPSNVFLLGGISSALIIGLGLLHPKVRGVD